MVLCLVAFHVSFLIAIVLAVGRVGEIGPNLELSRNLRGNARVGLPVSIVLGLVAFSGVWVEALRQPRYPLSIVAAQVVILLWCVLRDAPAE